MGIKKLNENLKQVKSISNFTEPLPFDIILNIRNSGNPHYLDLINKYNQNNLKKKQVFSEERKLCHIDFSNMLYKLIHISTNMKDLIKNCQDKINFLKQKNDILLYIDPININRKTELQIKRKLKLNILSNKISNEIFQNAEKVVNLSSNLTLDYKIKDMLSTSKKCKTYEDYIEFVDYFNNNYLIKDENSLGNINCLRQNLSFLERETFDCDLFKTIEDSDDELNSENKVSLFETIDVSLDELINEIDENDEKLEFTNENEVFFSQNQLVDLFKVFINSFSFRFHMEYLLNKLIENKTITEKELIHVELHDAELEIILQIKNKFHDRINIIFSNDQDILLFGLLFLKKELFYITHKYNLSYANLICLERSTLSKNIALITFYLHESDYFPGFTGLVLSEIKLKNQKNIELLSKEYSSNKELLVAWMKNSIKNKPKDEYEDNNAVENIELLLAESERYLNLDQDFFNSKNNIKFKISKNDAIKYFSENF